MLPVGDGTRRMARYKKGEYMNIMLPLGNSFTIPSGKALHTKYLLLVGGGVGSAPMLYLGEALREAGFTPSFLIGARSSDGIVQQMEYANQDPSDGSMLVDRNQ